ncbi:MAG: hypothetical protein HC819_01950 [Cyclobacteriaceae bacterium]|nr:hypothetical protein [Cyclobacteriaceae bacterium]
MKQSIVLLFAAILVAFSCVSKKENDQVVMENEELKAELARAQLAVSTLEEVGTLMDSIDKARNALKLELEAGTNYDDYLQRMNDINNYVSDTEAKIASLEQELNKSSSNNQSYIKTINKLKADLADKSNELTELQTTVENYKQENTDLLNTVDLKTTQIADLESNIAMKMEELNLIENRIQELMKKSQMSEADANYALGEALEEAAKRTKLAPKKKKETLQEALDYYQKSLDLGRQDAQAKIDELKEKV